MAAAKMRLSARNLKELPAGQMAWDTDLKGFGARMAASGTVTLFLNYQVRGTGRYKRHTIAHLGEMTVDKARQAAAQMKLEIRAGMDPAEQAETPTAKAKNGDTLGALADQWLNDKRHKWSDSTRKGYVNAMRRDLLGSDTAASRIGDVTRRDLMQLVDASTGRSPSSGALFFRTLNSFLSWADARGLTEVTLPKAGRAAPSPDARTRVLADDEIAALWRTAGELRPVTALAGRLMLVTAQRSGAVQALHRDWVTQAGVTWPAEVMKSGREHWTPLTPWALEQVRGVLERDGHVFGRNTSRLSQAWPAWRKAAGVDEGLRMHDVRRSMRTWAAAKGYGHEAAEAALAHQVQRDALAKAYMQHDFAKEAGEVIRGWQKHLEAVVA